MFGFTNWFSRFLHLDPSDPVQYNSLTINEIISMILQRIGKILKL